MPFTTSLAPAAASPVQAASRDRDAGFRMSRTEWIGYFVMTVAFDLAVGATQLPKVAMGDLLGPDSYMRLVRLQEMLEKHAAINVVARDGSGAGTLVHWSHLLDAIILILAAPLCLLMDASRAVHWAGVALGPLSMGLLGVSLVWVLAPLTDPRWRWVAPLMATASQAIVGYGVAGVVHHHVLVAFFAVVTSGLAARAAFRTDNAAWLFGVSAGAGLWLSPETFPLSLLAFGTLGLGWLLHPGEDTYGQALRNGGCGFLVVSAAALALDPPTTGYASVEFLHISTAYAALVAVLCSIGWWTWQLDRWQLTPSRRAILGILGAAVTLGLWIATYPAVLKGPEGALQSSDASFYFGVIAEMQPIRGASEMLSLLFSGAMATAAAAAIAAKKHSLWWASGAVCGLLALVLALGHRRFATYPEVFAAAMLPALATMSIPVVGRYRSALGFLIIGAFFLPPAAAAAFTPSNLAVGTAPNCSLANIGRLLAPYGGRVVMAEVNDTPELLYRSKVLTVGSLYTNVAAFMRLSAAWRSEPGDDVPEAVRATKANLLLFCPSTRRSLLVGDLPPNTLLDRMNRHDVPRWLVEIGRDPASDYVLYRIEAETP